MSRSPLVIHGGLFAGIAVGAVMLAALWPSGGATRIAAAAGAGLCGVTGVLALVLKQRARTLNGALLVVMVVFGVRAFAVMIGAMVAARWGGGVMPFVWGFFGTYFALQWVEISYLLAEAKQARSQQVERR